MTTSGCMSNLEFNSSSSLSTVAVHCVSHNANSTYLSIWTNNTNFTWSIEFIGLASQQVQKRKCPKIVGAKILAPKNR